MRLQSRTRRRAPAIRRPVIGLCLNLHRLVHRRGVGLVGGELGLLHIGDDLRELRLLLDHGLLELQRKIRVGLQRGERGIRRRLPGNGLRDADDLRRHVLGLRAAEPAGNHRRELSERHCDGDQGHHAAPFVRLAAIRRVQPLPNVAQVASDAK